MGWSGSILRGRCDQGMTLLRCASAAYNQPRGERRDIGAEAAGICIRLLQAVPTNDTTSGMRWLFARPPTVR
jgi:hypothetical protein